jgi:hypothetical protein
MNDPAIVGIHRVEFDRATGNPHGVGDLADTLSQFVVPHGAPMTDVDLHSVRIPILGLKNPIQKKLQIFQGLSVGTDQCVAFGRKNLELTTAVGLDFLDIRDEAEVTKHRVQYLLGFHFLLRVNNYDLAITLALGNLGALRNLDQRLIRLFSRQVHLGYEKEVLHRPVQGQP